jgi:hypothetical protein
MAATVRPLPSGGFVVQAAEGEIFNSIVIDAVVDVEGVQPCRWQLLQVRFLASERVVCGSLRHSWACEKLGLRKTWQAIQFGISLAHSQGLIFHGQFSVVWG